MTTVSVRTNIAAVRRKYKGAAKQVDNAARRALNRTAQQVRTVSVRALSKETGVKQRSVRDRVSIRKANYSTLSAEVQARPRTYNIASFGARQTKQGVSSSAWGKRRLYKGGFLINGGRTALIRLGKSRLPLKPLWGPRIHREFERDVVNKAMVDTTRARFPINFRQQLRFALGRIGIKVD